MLIEYRANGMRREVTERGGEYLVRKKLATKVLEAEKPGEDSEISERTGLPKRRYRRRDLQPES